MAPRGNKRTTFPEAAATSPKKSRVDPMLAGVVATLQDTEDLNEHCREMLVAMLPGLSRPKGERHDVQQVGVTMIEETLQARKKSLIESRDEAQKELSDLEGSKSTFVQRVNDAKVLLEEKKAAKKAAHAAHENAKASTKAAADALAAAMELQNKSEATHSTFEKDKAAIDAAYLEHFKIPMEANTGPHHIFLKPFLETLDLEEALMSALPSSCVKTKEQRGGFDDLVLSQLEKALIGRIGTLEKSLMDEASVMSECKASVASAEEESAAKKLTEENAAADLEAAKAAQSEAEEEVNNASEELAAWKPREQEAIDKYRLHDTRLMEFVDGPLKSFETLRDNEVPMPIEGEAATAGA